MVAASARVPTAAGAVGPTQVVAMGRLFTAGAFVFWMLTRCLMLVHQGAWPWMNAFVFWAAQGLVKGDWNQAVRPPLPAILGIPLVVAGGSEGQVIAVLYLLASAVQFAAFLVVVRLLFRRRLLEQTLAVGVFLLLPLNHSIHHYRDLPVVLGSAGVFLLAAHWLWATRSDQARVWRLGSVAWVVGASVLGIWSRFEVVSFVGAMVLLGLLVWRPRAARLAALYAAAVAVAVGALLTLNVATGGDLALNSEYQTHTFLDSLPDWWLSDECRQQVTENCRDRDGAQYFAPVDRRAGAFGMVFAHPLTALNKTVQSAAVNLWTLYGLNPSTFLGIVPLLAGLLIAFEPSRAALRALPREAWPPLGAAFAMSVLPPLSWAPPHAQYHLNAVLPVAALLAATLGAVRLVSRGRLLVTSYMVASAALSAFRYTRYPGT